MAMNFFIERTVGKFDFDQIWQRLQSATTLKNLSQLASILGIKQPTVSKAKKHGEFPLKWALCIAKIYFLNAEWVLYGNGPIRQGRAAETVFQCKLERLNEILTEATSAGTPEEYEAYLDAAGKLREEIDREVGDIADKRSTDTECSPEISELLEGAKRVLESGNVVAFDALERNIRYFDFAIQQEQRMAEMEKRLAALEEKGGGEKPSEGAPSSHKKVA
ncbi:MAG: helix-turn-helix domain-containing protein [Desulfobulbaceae bacterium]|jgi:hypothetical protein